MRTPLLARTALLSSLASLALGCAAPAPALSSGTFDPGGGVQQSEVPVGGDLARARMQDPQGTLRTPVPERQLRRSASLRVEVDELEAAVEQVTALLRELGGYSESADASAERALIRARVPSASFDDALERFAALGEELGRSVRAEDVTEQLRDLDTRIENQRALVRRLRALFERGGSVEDLLQVEKELARTQTELERLLGQRESLGRQVALSVIEIALLGPGESTWPGPGGLVVQIVRDFVEWFWRPPEGRILRFP